MFKVVKHTITNDPIYIMYKDQIVLNLQMNSLINSIFAEKIANKLNKTLLADKDLEDTLDHYIKNKKSLMGIFEE